MSDFTNGDIVESWSIEDPHRRMVFLLSRFFNYSEITLYKMPANYVDSLFAIMQDAIYEKVEKIDEKIYSRFEILDIRKV